MSERGFRERMDGGGGESLALTSHYLTFRVAGESYAVGILKVREILQYGTVTRVPNSPPFIHGVMNLRGSVVPVVDLAAKFGLPPTEVTRRTCVILVEIARGDDSVPIGVLADSVNDLVELPAPDIEPPPPFGPRIRVDFLLGMGRIDGGFLLLLNLDRILSEQELAVTSALREAGAAQGAADGGAGEEAAPAPKKAHTVPGKRGAGADGLLPEDVLRAGEKRPSKKNPATGASAEHRTREPGGDKVH